MLQDINTLATLVNNLSDPAWVTTEKTRIFGDDNDANKKGELAQNEIDYNNLTKSVESAQFDLDEAKQVLESYRDPSALTTL